MKCPECDGKSGHWSTGDGYQEWDECPCCNANGKNDTGETMKRRVAAYRKEIADEAARIDQHMKTPCKKCGVETWACECGAQWATVK